jgi:hypothetical protein
MTARYAATAAAFLAAMAFGSQATAQRCEGGTRVADLGFNDLGGSVNIRQHNNERPVWEFGGEPVIGGVRSDGPAGGRLRNGDVIVAVDGQLITTREGGRRYTAIDPGDRVRLSIRRGGRVQDVTVVAGSRCMRPPRPPQPPRPPTPPTPPQPPRAQRNVPPAPPRPPAPPQPPRNQRNQRDVPPAPPAPPVPPRPPVPPTPPAPPAPPEIMPDGWFGFGIECRNCDIHAPGGTAPTFRFREQPTVMTVEPGTPAASAGMRRGDRLTHVDGVSITTPDGWRRFGAIQPGQQVRWTFTRGGRAQNAVMTARRRPDAGRTPAPPAAGGQRLRYSGAVGGAQVEVRGAPVNVTTDPRTGEMIIRSADLTIRIAPQRP